MSMSFAFTPAPLPKVRPPPPPLPIGMNGIDGVKPADALAGLNENDGGLLDLEGGDTLLMEELGEGDERDGNEGEGIEGLGDGELTDRDGDIEDSADDLLPSAELIARLGVSDEKKNCDGFTGE